jgi:hypothetical protein
VNGVQNLRAILYCGKFFPSRQEAALWANGVKIENGFGVACFSGGRKAA